MRTSGSPSSPIGPVTVQALVPEIDSSSTGERSKLIETRCAPSAPHSMGSRVSGSSVVANGWRTWLVDGVPIDDADVQRARLPTAVH